MAVKLSVLIKSDLDGLAATANILIALAKLREERDADTATMTVDEILDLAGKIQAHVNSICYHLDQLFEELRPPGRPTGGASNFKR
jgi:hypothetical protein